MARPDRAAGLYGAINAISDRLDPLIRRFALNRPSQLISRTDSITAVQLSRKSGAVQDLQVCRERRPKGQREVPFRKPLPLPWRQPLLQDQGD
jgi:hypothetical protein